MRLFPLPLVVSRIFVSLPILTGVACATAAVLVDASTTIYRERKQPLNPKTSASNNHIAISIQNKLFTSITPDSETKLIITQLSV